MPDHHGAIPYRDANTPHSRVYSRKLEDMIGAGRHPDDAAWEGRRHALAVISPEEAARNRQVVEALGITYGAAPAPTISPSTDISPADASIDWDEIFQANRR